MSLKDEGNALAELAESQDLGVPCHGCYNVLYGESNVVDGMIWLALFSLQAQI